MYVYLYNHSVKKKNWYFQHLHTHSMVQKFHSHLHAQDKHMPRINTCIGTQGEIYNNQDNRTVTNKVRLYKMTSHEIGHVQIGLAVFRELYPVTCDGA